MDENVDEILSACIDRLIAGASLEEVLAGQPEQVVAALAPTLRDAQALLRSNVGVGPEGGARAAARERMFTQLDAARAKANEFQPEGGAVAGGAAAVPEARAQSSWIAGFMRRPASFRAAAVAGSVAVFGVLGVGAAAATGNTPEPVREFFRSSATSGLRVEFEGFITAADPAASTFTVQIGEDDRLVRVVESTELSRGGAAIAFSEVVVGDFVEVKGALQPDDVIVASRVHVEGGDGGDDDGDRTAEPGATIPDDDDDRDDDDDDDVNDDDDDRDDDSSGPGDADDDEDDGDNSGRGNGDDDDAGNDGEDNSGSDSDDDDDDSSSSEAGDDDGDDDDDSSGPGSGGDGDDEHDDD